MGAALAQTLIGNPLNEKVKMGSLAGQSQREEVRAQVQKLLAASQLVYGSLDSVTVMDADAGKGAFISPLLLMNEKPFVDEAVHSVEAFGPVSHHYAVYKYGRSHCIEQKRQGLSVFIHCNRQ